MTIITLEEHFLSEAAHAASKSKPNPIDEMMMRSANPELFNRFRDLSDLRISDMDAGQVTLQVISHGSGSQSVDQCRASNDQLAAAVRKHPDRFAGFADLPMHDPSEATRELRRMCARSDGVKFVGALVDSHTDEGVYYDGPEYDVLWGEAVRLDVPIYLHPTIPSENIYTGYLKSPHLSDQANLSIQAFGFGWHSDVAIHVLRLFAAGVFDRFPSLKMIIGHFGEMIPYMLQRIEKVSMMWGLQRGFREVWDDNFWVTTSGNWSLDPMACMLRNTKPERVMYSVDYPFGKNTEGLTWLKELEVSGMVSEELLEGIKWRNAARLLRLNVIRT